ncbi:helix-turn-helix domain-containing protein [Salmonella enterica]|nr:helix-turn-helix domain-containing protein [Salmonella enterica]
MNLYLKQKIRRQFTQAKLAASIGLPQQVISRWVNGEPVPPKRVIQLCELLGWDVTPHEVRPDIYPNATDGLPSENILSQLKTQRLNNDDHP